MIQINFMRKVSIFFNLKFGRIKCNIDVFEITADTFLIDICWKKVFNKIQMNLTA